MWFTRLAINRPILIWMAVAAIMVLGIEARLRLPVELNPRVDIPTITVTTAYPGAGPPEIDSQVSKPIQDAVSTVAGVKDVTTRSEANVSVISIDFHLGTDLDSALANVRARLDAVRAQLPAECRAPVVAKLDINALPVLYLGFTSRTLSLRQLWNAADNVVKPRLERIDGVADVQVMGGDQQEIRVSVDPARLAQFGLTIEDVVNALKAAGHDISGGGITYGSRETDVRLAGAFSSLDAIRSTQIPGSFPQSAAAGVPEEGMPPTPPVTVADVATVTDTVAPRTEISRINGLPGVSVAISKSPGSNAVQVVHNVEAALKDAGPAMAGVDQVVLRDDSQTVRDALTDVNTSLILGAVLAMLVVLLFLHSLRGTVIVSLAIPLCIVATFLVMWAVSFTLNQMTLLALSLSVGILLDDSIVILESITRHLRNGETPREAAFNGRTEIGFADITTTLVDVVVFVPIAFMGGIVGGFFREFGLTVAAATLFSLAVSFSLTPMLASRWYRQGEKLEARAGIFAPLEHLYQRLEAGYRSVIVLALRRRPIVILTCGGAIVLVFALAYGRLDTELIPGTDQGQIAVNIQMPPGASLAATDQCARAVENQLSRMPEVAATVTNVGRILGGFGSLPQDGAEYAQIGLRLRPRLGIWQRLVYLGRQTGARLRSDIEVARRARIIAAPIATAFGANITTVPIRSEEGAIAPVEIQIRGSSVAQITDFAAAIRQKLAAMPGVLDPAVSVRSGRPEVVALIDRERAAALGVAPAVAGANLHDSVAGNTDSIYRQNGVDVPIRVQVHGMQVNNPRVVGNVNVGVDSSGAPIALADIATLELRSAPTRIDSLNGLRQVTVTANLAATAHIGAIETQVNRALAGMPHAGIDVTWGGDAETINENIVPFISAILLAIALVYMVMAALFNSLGTPFVIMLTLPMALVGAVGALVLTGQTLSLVAGIGIIMLIGLMGRNAILLLDYTNTLRARGMARNDAIVAAGATRLRPILMTTTATIAGMLPVALRIGRASEVRAPMAIVVIGGLLVSTLLTLVVIPVLYSVLEDYLPRSRRDLVRRKPTE
ncbi:MAG: efflux RND transporter permease subunit [Armatimonadetes bacterium]|nr:efflux RND transporter permease subunit [Armatimonadota bacterium]MDE2206837.1 efflux RND transporter permease subunit [Armatimonadota bacterium]